MTAMGVNELEEFDDTELVTELVARFTEGDLDSDQVKRLTSLLMAQQQEELDRLIENQGSLAEAAARWQRGDKREALHHLEIALGDDFYGLERLLDGAK